MDDVIDLCDSFTLVDHQPLSELLIELDDDDSEFITESYDCIGSSNSEFPSRLLPSIDVNLPDDIPKLECSLNTKHRGKKKNTLGNQTKAKQKKSISKENKRTLGDCPICFDELGQNPLASTKCGHVYCMKCIEHHLLKNKNCPTCRKPLKSSSYHPLYIA